MQRAKNEDVVATVLSRRKVGRYYRFYGARHSILQLGYLVDFEEQEDNGLFLPRMRALSHIAFPWIFEAARLMTWQNLLQQLERHLRDTEEIDPFYFERLTEAAKKWHRQNPKRLAVEFYTDMLEHEGRLHDERACYVCDKPLGDEIALMAGFKPAHPHCIYAPSIRRKRLQTLFETKKSTFLNDDEVEMLYALLMRAF